MNKKLQKGLVAAVAATLSTGIVAPVYAASVETKSFDAQYAEAYNATVNAKTQKELTAARVLVDKLYADLPQDLKNLAATLSAILDPKQQTELVKLDDAIKAAEAVGTQKNVNAARALIVDMPTVWKNSFSSYIDTIQQALVNKAVEAAKKAQTSGVQADLDAAKALYEELLTVTNNDGVKSFVETAVKAELDKVVVEAKVESVSAVASKKLEVKFNQPVDTAKAVVTVKRDGIKSNVTATTWNTAKTVATIELTSKVSKAVYTVEVTGIADKAVTGTVNAEDERVSSIEVLSTEAPLVDLDGASVDDLSVPYRVLNQYGEDITKVTSLIASNGSVDAAKGVINFIGNYDTVTNKTVAFTLINVDSNVSTTAIVTAVTSAKEASIEIKGIYNKDGKTLTETTDLAKDKFFVEVEVKDQYGNIVKSPSAAGLILSESNNTIVDVDDSVTAGQPELDTTTVDGKVLIPLKKPSAGLKAGETTVVLIARNTGKSATTVVKVAEGVRANNVTLGQPELVAAGEDALIPVTVLDKEGNEIKDLEILNNPVRGLSLESGNSLVLKDNTVYVKMPSVAVGPKVAIVTVKPTQKIVTVNFTVKEAAVPKVIAGLDSAIQTSLSAGLSQDIKAQDLVIEDQYGRVMTDAKVNAWISTTNRIVVTSSYDATLDKSPLVVVSTADAVNNGENTLTASGDILTVTTLLAAGLNATEKLTFALSTDSGATTLATSAKDVVFSRVGMTEFASYEVSAPSVMFNDTSTYNFKVYGVKADGSKTLLNKDQYNVVYTNAAFTFSDTNNNKLALTAALTTIDDDSTTDDKAQSKDYTFKVVIADSAATTISKVVKVSAEARKVVDFKVASNGTSTGTALDKLVYEASVAAGDDSDIINLAASATNVGKLDMTTLENNLYYIDQYGKETATPVAGTVYLTFANVVDKDTTVPVTITKNGSDSTVAYVDGLEAGDTLKTTITIGSIVKTFDVEIK